MHLDPTPSRLRRLAGLALALSAALLGGCCLQPIDRDQATEILLDQVITQQQYDEGFVAYSLDQLLTGADVIEPDDFSGTEYREPDSWFFYVDDNPAAFYGHPVRYVFIDRCTGRVQTFDEEWWPALNGTSIFDLEKSGTVELTRIYPAGKAALETDGEASGAPEADYGDAPDDSAAELPDGSGDFPTTHDTANSRISQPGAHALTTGEEQIGDSVSRETDATDPADPDGRPNLIDNDLDDRTYLLIDRAAPDSIARLAFYVTVAATAPDIPRFVNAALDLDVSLDWQESAAGAEWVVKNFEVSVPPGSRQFIFTDRFRMGLVDRPPSGSWTRIVLSRSRIDGTLFALVGGWDGSGEFRFGEVEDSIFYTRMPFGPPPPPPPLEPPPEPPPPEPPPEEDEWGTPIAYKAIIVNGGDRSDQTIVQEAADTMSAALAGQGYDLVADLNPGNTAAGDLATELEDALTSLLDEIICVDRIFIYIIAHGSKAGYFVFKDAAGKKEKIEPDQLKAILEIIPSCKDELCTTPRKNCHVEVFLESCYAGNFATALGGTGRNVVTSSAADEVSWSGSDGTGGELSDEVSSAFDDTAADTNSDGSVSFKEAFERAKRTKKTPKPQSPSGSFDACPCECPPPPHYSFEWYFQLGEEAVVEVPEKLLVELPPEVEYRLAEPGTFSHGMASTGLPPGMTLEGGVISGRPQEAGEYLPLVRIYDPEGHVVGEIWWYFFVQEARG